MNRDMKRFGYSTLVVVALAFGFQSDAWAQFRWQLQMGASSGFTDNVESRPRTPQQNEPGAEPDGFADISPALRLSYGSPRFLQELNYAFFVNLYFLNGENVSFSNRLEWLGLIQASDSVRLTLGVNGDQGRQSSYSVQGDAAATALQAQPSGNTWFVNAGVVQDLQWDMTPEWQFSQSFTLGTFYPLDIDEDTVPQAPGLQSELHFAVTHQWPVDNVTGDFGIGYVVNLPYVSEDGNDVADEHQTLYTLTASWERSWTPNWISTLRVGVIIGMLPTEFSGLLQPTGGIGVRYRRELIDVELVFNHTIQPNILVAQTYMVEETYLRAQYPLSRTYRLSVSGSLGYQYLQTVEMDRHRIGDPLHVGLADLDLTWRQSDYLELSLRYQFSGQTGDTTNSDPNIISFFRNVAMINVAVYYPVERNPRRLRRRSGSGASQSDWNQLFNTNMGSTPAQ